MSLAKPRENTQKKKFIKTKHFTRKRPLAKPGGKTPKPKP